MAASTTLNLDAHGKSLSFRLLDMTVQVSPALAARLPDTRRPPSGRLIHHKNTQETHDAHALRTRLALLLAAALPLAASAQSFPAKPITFIVPFAAGSATDQIGRAIGQGVTEQTGQAVVIENKPGASAMIGAAAAARAATAIPCSSPPTPRTPPTSICTRR